MIFEDYSMDFRAKYFVPVIQFFTGWGAAAPLAAAAVLGRHPAPARVESYVAAHERVQVARHRLARDALSG